MEKIIAYTSGGALGNPGPAAAGVYIVDEKGDLIQEAKQSLGNGTENFAEYYGVMLALQTLITLYSDKTTKMNFEVRLDNELVKKQLNSESPINEPGLVPMFIEIHNMCVASFPKLTFTKIKPAKNKEAIRLVSETLDS
ncbi:MAG: reverse transcriptase-like protein [Candidatus Paceibacterota bacterium]